MFTITGPSEQERAYWACLRYFSLTGQPYNSDEIWNNAFALAEIFDVHQRLAELDEEIEWASFPA